MTQKKSNSSKLVRSLKKGVRSLASGKKDLTKLAAALPLMAVLVEEVRAAQAKTKTVDELFQSLPPTQADQLDVDQKNLVQDAPEGLDQVAEGDSVQDDAKSARESLRAVLEEEIADAQATASATKIDPSSPDAGQQAVRSILNDEVNYEVAKALEASPNAAEVLAKLPDVNFPQAFASNFSGFPTGGAVSVAVAALTGGGGGGLISSAVANATGVQVAGFVIDGYVSGATVFADLNGNFSWDDGEPYARTDDSGRYAFTTQLDLTDVKIVSLGGLDTATLAPIKMMVGALGYNYITPVSTLYTQAGGETALQAAGLNLNDLSYDPVAQLNGANPDSVAQAAVVLTISQSLLVTLNNATALIKELTGADDKAAFDSVFAAIQEAATGADGVTNLLTNAAENGNPGAGVSFLKSALIHSGMSADDVSDGSGYGLLINAAASAMAVVNDALLALGQDPAAVQAGENLAWASIGQQTLLTEIQAVAKQFVPGSTEAQAAATALNSKFSSVATESLVATQAAKWAFSKADGSGVTTSADVLSIDAPVGVVPTVASTNVLANDSASTGSLSLVAVGLLDARVRNTTASVSQETQDAVALAVENSDDAPATWTLTLAQGPTSTATDYFAGMKLQVTSGLEDGQSVNVDVVRYRILDGVAMVDVQAPDGVDVSDLGENFDVLISKPLPSDLTVSFEADGLVTVTRSADGEGEIGQYDLIYVAQRSVTNALTSEVTVEGAKVGLLTVYVQPQAPDLALTLATPANPDAPTSVAEAAGDALKTSVVLNLGIEAGALGVNGSIEIRDLPPGVSFVNGSTPIGYYSAAKDSWILSASATDFSELEMLVPGNFSGTITPTVIATSRYANLASSTTLDDVTITITPTTDGFKTISAVTSASLDNFFEDALYSQGVEDKASGLISDTDELAKFVQGLRAQLIDTDGSEHLALALELPQGWEFLLPASLGSEYVLLDAVAGHGPVLRLFESNGLTLTQILPKLSVLPAADYATNAAGADVPVITAKVASFEASLLGTARWNSEAVFDQSIQILPVSDAVTLSATTAGWNQSASWNASESVFGVAVTPTVTNSDDVGPDETYYLEVSKADLDLIKVGSRSASLDESTIHPGTLSLVNGWYRFKPSSEDGVFKINVPDTLYGADFSVRVRPLGLDVGLASDTAVAPNTNFTTGSAVAVHFAVAETAFAPTVEFGRLAGYKEDTPIALNKLVVVTPYLERTLDTVTVSILVADNFTVHKTGQSVALTVDAGGYVHIPALQLANYSVMPAENFNGSIDVEVTASDAKHDGSGTQASAPLTLPVPIESVIDGFELVEQYLEGIRNDLASIEVNTKEALKLYDPDEAGSETPTTYLGKLESYIKHKYLSVKDEGEVFSVNLVFANTEASAVVVKVGGQAVFPSTNAQGSLVFTLSQDNLESNSLITLEGSTGLFGKSMSLEVFTQDGTNISPVLNLATSAVDLTTDAVAPNAAVGAAFGSEDDAGISIPVTLPVDASRAGFEKVGLQIQTTNTALQAGKFTAELVGSDAVLTFNFDAISSTWRIFDQVQNFDQVRQIDFSTLKYVPQADYSGKAQFSVTSFAKTASDETLASVTSNFVVNVKAVAETINFQDQSAANALLAGSGLEDSLINLNLGQYFKNFKADADGSERIILEIELPKGVSLVKSGATLTPSSVGETTTKTVVVLDEANFAEQVALLRLQPSANYSSTSAAGDNIVIKARAVESSGESAIIKTSSGAESLNLKFVVTPDADTPIAPVVAKTAATINEYTAAQTAQTDAKAWLKVDDLIRLPSKTSVDADETLSVQLTMTQPGLELFIKSSSVYVQVNPVGGVYSVAASNFANLYVRGVEYASGAVTLSAKTVATDYWNNKTGNLVIADSAESAAVSVTVNLKPIANGIDAQVVQANQQTTEDSSGIALNSLIATDASPKDKDGSETLVYKFAITPAFKLVATTGTVPTPVVAPNGRLEYTLDQSALTNFKLVPIANFSGVATVDITAGTKEKADNSTLFSVNKVSAQIAVTAVADAPTLVTPATASGLGAASIPILASVTDKTITSISGDVAESLSVTISAGSSIKDGDIVTLRSGEWSARLPSDGSAITIDASLLQGLSVTTREDYRGTSSLNLTVKATSSEANGSTAPVESLIKVSVFQTIEAPDLNLTSSVLK